MSRICASVLAVLGFGCSSDGPDDPYICMYGTPYGSFEIKGKVTTEDGTAVANAAVRITGSETPSGVYSFAETTTDKTGDYTAKGTISGGWKKWKVVCIPEDKSLDADSVIVDMEFIRESSDDFWNHGHADATVDLTLKNKKTEE